MPQDDTTLPVGLCQCGCGRPTTIARKTDRRKGVVRGQPYHYCHGHAGTPPRPAADRLWARVDKTGGPDACWDWQGSTSGFGYGRIAVDGRGIATHRLAWELDHGKPAPDLEIMHLCDNARCCNPAHLAPGTHAENMQHMVRQGRHATLRGVQHARAKLDDDKVREIRLRRAMGEGPKALAEAYGVSDAVIISVVKRKTWKHVTD